MTNYVPIFFDIETTGFNPLQQAYFDDLNQDAQVTAIGVGLIDDGWKNGKGYDECESEVHVLYDESEYRLLENLNGKLEEWVAEYEEKGYSPFLVTFNGRQFDHPYLGARYARLRLDGSWWNHRLKRLDMMRALGKHWGKVDRYPSEDDCLEAANIESTDPYDGSDMPEAFSERDWDMISEHVEKDTREMIKLFCDVPEMCMSEFYSHYDVDADATFTEEVEF